MATNANGTTILVGAVGGEGVAEYSGAAYLFQRSTSGWTETDKLFAADGELADRISYLDLSADGRTAAIGAYSDDDLGVDSGSVYLFEDVNTPPSADAGGPYDATEGVPILLDATASSDAEQSSDSLLYEWDFDSDGEFDDAVGSTPSFTGVRDFNKQFVSVRVTDDLGATAEATTTVSIGNAAPQITSLMLEEPSISEGSEASLSVALFDYGAGFVTDLLVDWGDETSPELFKLPSGTTNFVADHLYDDNPASGGAFTITVTARENDGAVAEAQTSVEVVNEPPAGLITAIVDGEGIVTYESVTFVLAASDSLGDLAGEYQFQIDWDDDGVWDSPPLVPGTAEQTVTHSFSSLRTHTITAVVTDKDGDVSAPFSTTVDVVRSAKQLAHESAKLKVGGSKARFSKSSVKIEYFDDDGNLVATEVYDEDEVAGGLIIYGSDEADELIVDEALTLPVELYGGGGDDLLQGGGGENLIVGGDGDDTLVGGGVNTLDGGEGNDTLQDSGGTNTIIGGSGDNTFVPGGATNTFEPDAEAIAPIVFADAYFLEDNLPLVVPASVGVLVNDLAVDGGALSAVLELDAEFGDLTLLPDGGFSYTPPVGFQGVDHFRYRAVENGVESSAATASIQVGNAAPEVAPIIAPVDPVAAGSEISATADFSDLGVLDTHSAEWDWGDGTTSPAVIDETEGSGTVAGSHVYEAPGVYTIRVTVADDFASTTQEFRYVVVYDASAGFVTGGGWIDSPLGAYAEDPTLTGRASFGFVSRYKKGATTPTGRTQFQFHAAGFDFHSTDYEWLVVAGNRAKFKGTGSVNGVAGYQFMVTATDGDPDSFRIKIWQELEGVETVAYVPVRVLSSGSGFPWGSCVRGACSFSRESQVGSFASSR